MCRIYIPSMTNRWKTLFNVSFMSISKNLAQQIVEDNVHGINHPSKDWYKIYEKEAQEVIPTLIKYFSKALPFIIYKKQVVSFNHHNSMSGHLNNTKMSFIETTMNLISGKVRFPTLDALQSLQE